MAFFRCLAMQRSKSVMRRRIKNPTTRNFLVAGGRSIYSFLQAEVVFFGYFLRQTLLFFRGSPESGREKTPLLEFGLNWLRRPKIIEFGGSTGRRWPRRGFFTTRGALGRFFCEPPCIFNSPGGGGICRALSLKNDLLLSLAFSFRDDILQNCRIIGLGFFAPPLAELETECARTAFKKLTPSAKMRA